MKQLTELLENFSSGFDGFVTKLDVALDKRKKSELYIIYLLPIVLFGYLSLELLLPAAEKSLKSSESNLKSIENQIRNYEASAVKGKSSEEVLTIIAQKNSKLKKDIEKLVDKNYQLEAKVEEKLKDLRYNRKNWSGYLFEVSDFATDNGLMVNNFSNSVNINLEPEKLSKVMSIDINATGKYRGVMKFLDALEVDDKVVEINRLSLQSGDKISFETSFDVWGVK